MRKPLYIGGALLAAGTLWYLFRPDALVVDRVVSEPFPASESAMAMERPATNVNASGMTMEHPDMSMGDSGMEGANEMADAVSTGRFHSNAHETSGIATIHRLADGRHVLRLTEFATSNGPDLRVYLVAADDVHDEDAAKEAGFVDLGELKGNVGDQNYELPSGLDLTQYRAVSIWCRRFSVNFGAAPLQTTM